jgi:Ca-activated chloride channel homolog
MILTDFHFIRPLWLCLFLPWGWLLWRLWRRNGENVFWQQICDPALIPYVVSAGNRRLRRAYLLPFILGGMLGILAMAGPTVERQPQPVFREQAALVILLDLSRSMDAADVAPSRIARARFKIKDLLEAREGGQTGLVVFAAHPYVVTPLTDDARTIDAQLSVLGSELMPSQGTDIPSALAQSVHLLQQAGYTNGDLLLLTDGISREQLVKARAALAGARVRLSILGFGTLNGAPIPQPDGGFVLDSNGGIVISKLESDALTELAQSTQGVYLTATPTSEDVATLVEFFSARQASTEASRTSFTASRWRDLGPWLLIPLLACAAFAFRPGLTFLFVFALGLGSMRPVQAEWWLTPDQIGQRAFDAQEYSQAVKHFSHQQWRAAANYRAGQYETAVEDLGPAKSVEDLYNKGNALARLGRFDEAIAAYDSALKQAPDHADALHNRKIVQDIVNPPPDQNSDQTDQTPPENEQSPEGGGQNEQGESADKPGEQGGENSQPQLPKDDDPSQFGERSEQQGERRADAKKNATDKDPNAAADAAKADSPQRTGKADNAGPGDQEEALATEQWLRQIPDDPGGLLRRKFRYQYSRQHHEQSSSEVSW